MKIHDSYGFLLAKLAQKVEQHFSKTVEPYHLLPRHVGVLLAIDKEEPSSQIELATHLNIDRTTMVAQINFLEEQHLVQRIRHPKDKRYYLITLTAEGETLVQTLTTLLHQSESSSLSRLSADEQIQLKELVVKALNFNEKE